MLTVLTVDDEPLALKRLALILNGMSDVRHVGSAAGCDEAIRLIADERPDVVLLDIHMRDGTGFDVVEALPVADRPAVIFVTAFDHFAIKAFEITAIDYVLKPIETGRLAAALDRARLSLGVADGNGKYDEMSAVIANLRARLAERDEEKQEREVWLRASTGTLTRVDLDDVELVTSEDDYVRLHTRAGSHLLRLSIAGLERKIDQRKYIRVHRSALVRTDCIRELRRGALGGCEVVMTDGTTVAAGRIYARRLRQTVAARNAKLPN